MRRKLGCLSFLVLITAVPHCVSQPPYHYVHPPPPPQAKDFAQPPRDSSRQWSEPEIRSFNTQCWSAEPNAPNGPVGGAHGLQKVFAFVPVSTKEQRVDRTFHQTNLGSFSGGGLSSSLTAEELPSGIFISFVGHPIYRITKVQYPSRNPLIPSPFGTLVTITADFQHEPQQAECFFYVAVWTSERSNRSQK